MHSCKVDRSPDTGSLVVCTCGLVLGPFTEHGRALTVAREHRRIHKSDHDAERSRKRRQATATT